MRKMSVLLMCLLASGVFWAAASAQDPTAGVIFFQHRQFKIPFKNDQKNGNITQVRLYVSRDQGRSWNLTATAAPEEQGFRFSTAQDGSFWFAVQTVDSQNKLFPRSDNDFRPELKVIIDATPPSVVAQPLQPRGGEVGVSWSVRDDNLDLALPDSVRVEYRLAGGVSWIPLPIAPGSNQHFWNPQTNGAVEVRVLARDRAGNIGQDKTTVSLVGGGGKSGLQQPLQRRSPIRRLTTRPRISNASSSTASRSRSATMSRKSAPPASPQSSCGTPSTRAKRGTS